MPTSEQAPEQLFAQLFEQLKKLKTPPVVQWHPRQSLDIDLRIAADGRWYYQGSVIERRRIVKLFGSVLRLESDGGYCLVTPRLKYPVTVDDAPFQAVELRRQGAGRTQNLVFRTNTDDLVLADRAHPIQVATDPRSGQPSPCVHVRDGLRAKISRAVYYELAEILEPAEASDGEDVRQVLGRQVLGVYSAGAFFPFGRMC